MFTFTRTVLFQMLFATLQDADQRSKWERRGTGMDIRSILPSLPFWISGLEKYRYALSRPGEVPLLHTSPYVYTSSTGADLCCPEIQNSLAAVKLDVEILLDFTKDLRARLGSALQWPPSKNAMCPPGFTYLPSVESCYMVVTERQDWFTAGKKCQQLRRGAHLTVITSAKENNAIKTFLASELSRNIDSTACTGLPGDRPENGNFFWTSGQRLTENCESSFVWKPSSDKRVLLKFDSWILGQPDCSGKVEFCLDIWATKDFRWNDDPCNRSICALCEYKP